LFFVAERKKLELRSKIRIGVVGAADCSAEAYRLAEEVGLLAGRAGALLVCGGRGGVMEASARGAKQAGGITIGILPGDRGSDANPYIDIPIVTAMGNARNVINVLTSHVIIAVEGSYGTLSEIALALKCGIPVIGLKTWDISIPGGYPLPIYLAQTPEEAVREALKAAQSRRE
jgi:uncharacterized protein (TIGR00725 family)